MFKIPDLSCATSMETGWFGLSFCVIISRSPYTCIGDSTGNLRHFDMTVRCAAHYAGATLSKLLWGLLCVKQVVRSLKCSTTMCVSLALHVEHLVGNLALSNRLINTAAIIRIEISLSINRSSRVFYVNHTCICMAMRKRTVHRVQVQKETERLSFRELA